MRPLFFGVAAAAMMFAASPQAATFTYTGTTTLSDPTFQRPLAGLSGLSGVGTAVHYNAFTFTAGASGNADFLSLATGAWDNFLILYSPSFAPAAGLSNAVAANDDGPPPAGIGSAGFSFNLTAGNTYTLVTTGFGNSDVGSFTNTIVSAVPIITAVPEPGQFAMLGLGLLGVGFASRAKKRNLPA